MRQNSYRHRLRRDLYLAPIMTINASRRIVTRRALIKAFSSPARTRQQTMEIVARYMGDAPVPPAWSRGGVQANFGKAIARAWARKIRHLGMASHAATPGGRRVFSVVQSIHDFPGSAASAAAASDAGDPHELAELLASLPKRAMLGDEFHSLLGPVAHEASRRFTEGALAAGGRP